MNGFIVIHVDSIYFQKILKQFKILSSEGQHKYAPKSFNTIGPSNANFVIASATSHDAASASILSFAAIFSLLAISVTTADMHLSACRARLKVPVPACSCPAQPAAACHAQMPATSSGKTTALGFLGYIHDFTVGPSVSNHMSDFGD
jgi:hypothetical protein